MYSADGRYIIVFNGETYNYQVIRSQSESEGFTFESTSDTEVILKLFEKFRSASSANLSHQTLSDFLNCLNGIFSFTLWDIESLILYLARDTFGVKPLYALNHYTGVYFSSELKVSQGLDFSINHKALNSYLTFLWHPGNETPVHEICKVGPGDVVTFSNGRQLDRFTWNHIPTVHRPLFTNNSITPADAVQGIIHHLRQAVHRQKLSDVPVGAFLFGGLDSSSIVNFARECNSRIPCFTIDTQSSSSEGFLDYLPYAQRVASHFSLPLHIIQVDASSIISSIERMVWQLDEPLADLATLNVLYISELARNNGIKVLLSGAGGDDIFSGYRRHLALSSERAWDWLPKPVRVAFRSLTRYLPVKYPIARRIRKALSVAHLDGDSRLVSYFRWIDREDLNRLYSPEFLNSIANSSSEDCMLDFLKLVPSSLPKLERMLALEQRFFLSDHNLNYTDKMSMAAGVEVRVPFLDIDLVNFASSLPHSIKQRGTVSKWVLKEAMRGFLPDDIIFRPKSGFGVPLRRWLRTDLREWLFDTLSYSRLRKRGMFNPDAVHALIEANQAQTIDASYTLLSLACVEIWCQYFIDCKPPPPVLNSPHF